MKKIILFFAVLLSMQFANAQISCVLNKPEIIDSLSECGVASTTAVIGDTLTVCIDSILYAESNGNLLDAVLPSFDSTLYTLIGGTGPSDNWIFIDSIAGGAAGGVFFDEDGNGIPNDDIGDDTCGDMFACGHFCFDFEVNNTTVDVDCPLEGIIVLGDTGTGGNPGGQIPLCDERDTVSTLPIDLHYFAGSAEEDFNLLVWVSNSEINNEGYFLQRSKDGIRFNTIEFIEGKGNSYEQTKYEVKDNSANELSYYRLIQKDFNGDLAYSDIIVLRRGVEIYFDELQVYPIPASDFISIDYNDERFTSYKLIDLHGKIHGSNAIDSESSFELIDIQHLASGYYFVQFFGDYFKSVPFVKQDRF